MGETPGEGRVVDEQLLLERGEPLFVLVAQHRHLPQVIRAVAFGGVSQSGRPARVTARTGRVADSAGWPTDRHGVDRPASR